mmetsp:Transcript_31616/g.100378  ORF Transcript_31616/g.100378 Transcript_31616/m.100378 type:complete len:235 (-) Transcript_31616:251-955(-)
MMGQSARHTGQRCCRFVHTWMQPKWKKCPQGSFSGLHAQPRSRSFMASGTSDMRQMRQVSSSLPTADFCPSSSATASRMSRVRRGAPGDSFFAATRVGLGTKTTLLLPLAPRLRLLPASGGVVGLALPAARALSAAVDEYMRRRVARGFELLTVERTSPLVAPSSQSDATSSCARLRARRRARLARSLISSRLRSSTGCSPSSRALRLRFGMAAVVYAGARPVPRRPSAAAAEA